MAAFIVTLLVLAVVGLLVLLAALTNPIVALIAGVAVVVLLYLRGIVFCRAAHQLTYEFMGRRSPRTLFRGPHWIPPILTRVRTDSLAPRKYEFPVDFFTKDGNQATAILFVFYEIDTDARVPDGLPDAGTSLFVSIKAETIEPQLQASLSQDTKDVGGELSTEACYRSSGVLTNALKDAGAGKNAGVLLGVKVVSISAKKVSFDRETTEALEKTQQADAQDKAFTRVLAKADLIKDPDAFVLAATILQGPDSMPTKPIYVGGASKLLGELIALIRGGGRP